MDSSFSTSKTLPSGLRVVVCPADTDVVYCGLAIHSGTRHETADESGMAHFTEHMSFKGTQRRRAYHINNRMEAVGGDLNAYTGKEETVYYCTCLLPHLARALDLLFDIVFHSTYPQAEMDKEVEVVAEEIESYNDTPSDLIFDDFEALLFPSQPLGRNILGDIGRLRRYTSADVQRYARRMYRPENVVVYVLGRVDLPTVERLVATFDLGLPSADVITKPGEESSKPLCAPKAEARVVDKHTHQAHVMMGATAYGGRHPRHLALYLLNNILGGPGMNSRLNTSLREHHGLVYTVESNLSTYTDTGVWSIYFGCNAEDVDHCRRLAADELHRLTDAPLSPRALRSAKRQLIGQASISYDNRENVALGEAKRFLLYDCTQSLADFTARIEALTADDLLQAAREVMSDERISTLIYSGLGERE